MNDVNRAATFSWLMSVAAYGKLPEGLPEEARHFAETFLSTAISLIPQEPDPEKLAVITQGKLEGEFGD